MQKNEQSQYLADIVVREFGIGIFFGPVFVSIGLIYQWLRNGTFIYDDNPEQFYKIIAVLFLITCCYVLIISWLLIRKSMVRDNEFSEINQQLKLKARKGRYWLWLYLCVYLPWHSNFIYMLLLFFIPHFLVLGYLWWYCRKINHKA